MKCAKISDYKIKKILKCFCLELTASQTFKQERFNRHTVERYYNIFREKIFLYQETNLQNSQVI